MSVASGKFFDGITSFAGGAPRANGTGNSKVFYRIILFSYQKNLSSHYTQDKCYSLPNKKVNLLWMLI